MESLESLIKAMPTLIKNFISWAVAEDHLDIHHNYQDQDEWAQLTHHLYDEDKEISIKLHKSNLCELHIGFYDEKDDFHELATPIDIHLLPLIPESLLKLMQHVIDKEEGIRVPGNLLLKK